LEFIRSVSELNEDEEKAQKFYQILVDGWIKESNWPIREHLLKQIARKNQAIASYTQMENLTKLFPYCKDLVPDFLKGSDSEEADQSFEFLCGLWKQIYPGPASMAVDDFKWEKRDAVLKSRLEQCIQEIKEEFFSQQVDSFIDRLKQIPLISELVAAGLEWQRLAARSNILLSKVSEETVAASEKQVFDKEPTNFPNGFAAYLKTNNLDDTWNDELNNGTLFSDVPSKKDVEECE